jgi:hypothetical protein
MVFPQKLMINPTPLWKIAPENPKHFLSKKKMDALIQK